MKRVQIVPLARADLCGVYDGFVADNPAAATAYLEGLDRLFRRLAEWPLSGRNRDTYRPGLRSAVYRRHLILYRPTSFGISVLRVIHSRQDIDGIFR